MDTVQLQRTTTHTHTHTYINNPNWIFTPFRLRSSTTPPTIRNAPGKNAVTAALEWMHVIDSYITRPCQANQSLNVEEPMIWTEQRELQSVHSAHSWTVTCSLLNCMPAAAITIQTHKSYNHCTCDRDYAFVFFCEFIIEKMFRTKGGQSETKSCRKLICPAKTSRVHI